MHADITRLLDNGRKSQLGDVADDYQSKADAWNLISGTVLSIHQGLTRTGIRIGVGEQGILRAKWPNDVGLADQVRIGKRVTVQIASTAVLLGVPGIWPGGDRWNRWAGRIVLVDPGKPHEMVTVKVFGEKWTLRSTGPVQGLDRPPQAWDSVNIVVDPAMVPLAAPLSIDSVRRVHWTTVENSQTQADVRLWVKGRLSGRW